MLLTGKEVQYVTRPPTFQNFRRCLGLRYKFSGRQSQMFQNAADGKESSPRSTRNEQIGSTVHSLAPAALQVQESPQ